MVMTRSRTDHPRPGSLKVFWPAFLGWGSLGLVILLAPSIVKPMAGGWSSTWGPIAFVAAVLCVCLCPMPAVYLAARHRFARHPLVLLANLSPALFVIYVSSFHS
jgi:hypothetical protein